MNSATGRPADVWGWNVAAHGAADVAIDRPSKVSSPQQARRHLNFSGVAAETPRSIPWKDKENVKKRGYT